MDGLLSQSRILNSSIFGGGASVIRNIQRGEVEVTALTHNVTISATSTSDYVARVSLKRTTSTNGAKAHMVRAHLTTSTNLRLTREDDDGSVFVSWEVIEFQSVKSVQSGLTTVAASEVTNVTINSVNMAKSLVFVSYSHSNLTTAGENRAMTLKHRLTSSTNLELDIDLNTASPQWFVVEFY